MTDHDMQADRRAPGPVVCYAQGYGKLPQEGELSWLK